MHVNETTSLFLFDQDTGFAILHSIKWFDLTVLFTFDLIVWFSNQFISKLQTLFLCIQINAETEKWFYQSRPMIVEECRNFQMELHRLS